MPLAEKKTGGAAKVKEAPGAAPLGKPVETLPCPRCESMNTKFCYYNNYSVTQPRHFCRQCQRYWTAGGTLRNVPVGGGSRKKNRASYPRIEPYSLQHRMVGGYAGVMQQPAAFQPGFQQLVTPDMAAFGHQNGYPQLAAYPPSMMYGTNGTGTSVSPLPLQMLKPAGLTFELNLAGGENSNNPQENIINTTSTSSGLLEPSASVNPIVGGSLGSGAEVTPGSKTTASPPHGSSTIEEEGSTPTNGYSNNGYEEGDAVSSMWHEMHDMDNVLFQ